MNEILVCVGIVLMACSALAAVISAVVFSAAGKRLRKKLDEEYGGQNV